MGTAFNRLTVNNWRQFESVDIDFSRRLTILTGANGAGKTTLLSFLTMHFGWHTQYISTPERDKSGIRSYLTGWRPWRRKDETNELGGQVRIGALSYAGVAGGPAVIESQITIPTSGDAVFGPTVHGQQPVHGVYLGSHRIQPAYSAVNEIPTRLLEPSEHIDEYENDLRVRMSGGYGQLAPAQRMKRSLISLGALGFGNEVIRRNERSVEIFRGFVAALRIVLPSTLKFEDLEIDSPEVLLRTGTGTFTLDAVSGGVASLIDTTWRIHMRSLQDPALCVVIDEPENHLHPAMQRSLLPSLMKAFPFAQFVVATHNPFIVGSVQDSHVYVLNYDQAGRVTSSLLDTVNRAGTSNEILREVLGLQFTIPIWVEDQLQTSVARFIDEPLTEGSLEHLRNDMKALGIEGLFPQTLAEALRTKQ